MKQFFFSLSIVFLLSILGGCSTNDDKKQEKVINKAKEIAIQHFKETENTDIVVTKTKFAPKDLGGIFVIGHVKGNKERKVTATINYNNNYEVESIT
ncbi:hypothetical protein [Bacillus sp. UNC437CL72CviS29]|uniref:hypothetical protein n=1 Tax=Bacillus sp. UNC437CL72CviS29 TaxID=1340430 RepID=UPI000558DBE2|nr:hypothetical protein [Bacillus sp. UNC437CL72CviS29]